MFDTFLSYLREGKPFSFSRWGDGELNSLLKIDGDGYANTDGHKYFDDMGEALASILISKPQYFLGRQRFGFEERYPEQINAFMETYDLGALNWVNADLFHHASIKGHFEQFFDVLVKRDGPVILVGPDYLKDLGRFFNVHVSVPEKNCWLERERIIESVRFNLLGLKTNGIGAIVLFVAGMPANYMVDVLHKEFGEVHTFLDIGSVLDPYVGKTTRGYHRKIVERERAKT